MNAIGYKQIWPLFRDRKCWYGCTAKGQRLWFGVPSDFKFTGAARDREITNNGQKSVRIKGVVRWFTNLEHSEMPEGVTCKNDFASNRWKTYDDYNAVECVFQTEGGKYYTDIPKNYDGLLAVGISFMDKLNPRQFEIVDYVSSPTMNGESVYKRLIIKARPGFTLPKPPAPKTVEKYKRKAGLRRKFGKELYIKQDFKCANPSCVWSEQNIYYDSMDLDHIVPVSKGGSNELDNLQLLCRRCNGKKSDRTVQGNSDI